MINPVEEGRDQSPATVGEVQQLQSHHWRQVAREIELTFIPMEPIAKASESWLKAHQDRILHHFLESMRMGEIPPPLSKPASDLHTNFMKAGDDCHDQEECGAPITQWQNWTFGLCEFEHGSMI